MRMRGDGDMNPDRTHIIFGPPGTGKTTELLRIFKLLLDDCYRPDEVMFVAFTRRAASEAKNRALQLGIDPEKLIWFRTLHSMAFNRLGLNRDSVMGLSDYFKICDLLGIRITAKLADDGTFTGMTRGDKLFFMENMARATMTPLKEHWEKFPSEDVYWYELDRLANTLRDYKEHHQKQDYTDIINRFVDSGEAPPVRAMIVDEAQDLTPLQWRMVHKLGERVEECHVAGDDDQSIFRWAGADPVHFQGLPGTRRILQQSYRVPRKVMALAHHILEKIQTRVSKVWSPRDQEGEILRHNDVEHIDMSQGTWLLLARNSFLLEEYNEHCIREGYVFDSSIGSPIKGKSFQAIHAWEDLRAGKPVLAGTCKEIYGLMSTRKGVAYGFKSRLEERPDNESLTIRDLKEKYGLITDSPWNQALDRIPAEEAEYFIIALRRGEKFLKEPRIRINTIHGVKGAEADNVVLMVDMADRTWAEYHTSPDDEHRVWYVGVTRARERLHILSPKTNKCYEL